MFNGTIDKLSTQTYEKLKTLSNTIVNALYLVAGLLAMILFALVTKLCPR